MPKLKMLKGLPASGKTTYAREQVRSDGNVGRINRDDLRAMLFDSVWSGKREGIIVDCEKAIAEVLFKHQHCALVDDTNLTAKHLDIWSGFAREKGVAFEAVDLNQPLSVCVQRDKNREKRVGLAVLHRMALFSGIIEWRDKPLILCDIDGTIADSDHRNHCLYDGPKKDWKAYYSELGFDRPIEFVIRWLREWAKTHTVCLVSGRPDTYQFQTVRWLEEHEVPFDYLFMRPGSSKVPDTEIKKAILDHLPKDKIDLVLDDRPRVIKLWQENGLRVIPVRGQIEDF